MSSTTRTPRHEHTFDVCVIGGGMAGMCCALAAARNGARTCIVHDRPVFGGNASSEIRMWICGAHGKHNKETGILEELQLDNARQNSSLNYSIWDSVLWAKMVHQPRLSVFLNTTCVDATTEGDTITAVTCWTLTSQSWHTIRAKQFVDCSGDSILAALSGAAYRVGREARHEFDEDIEPAEADRRTMGNSLLIQLRKTEEAQPFVPPRWAYKFQGPEDLPHRIHGVNAANFWWIEVGGLQDTIGDAEAIRDELMRISWGVWDYIKNVAPERDKAANWALEWLGALPGKRESRRYVGAHVLTQNEVRAGGRFDDVVAFGGWSMDDHHPAGIYYPGEPTVFHPAPSPYGIPYRSLYSKNIRNLLFAGRNISVTHAALSSTRVMATCAVLGQAAGTAAALCIKHGCAPRGLSSGTNLRELQETLMDDDAWLPGVLRPASALTRGGRLSGSGSERLIDGMDRDREDAPHAWTAALGGSVELRWDAPTAIAGVRLVLDSDLTPNSKRMPCSYPQAARSRMPATLIRALRIEAQDASGTWQVAARLEDNHQRLVRVPLAVQAQAIKVIPEATWSETPGDSPVRIFGLDALANYEEKVPVIPEGPTFGSVRAALDPVELAPPENTGEKAVTHGATA